MVISIRLASIVDALWNSREAQVCLVGEMRSTLSSDFSPAFEGKPLRVSERFGLLECNIKLPVSVGSHEFLLGTVDR